MATPAATIYEEHRGSSVSFSRSRGPSQQTEEDDDEDDIQISLAPYMQTYLAQSSHPFGCCGQCLPIPFERAARRSWWDPRFDSEILEGQYRTSSYPQVRLRFQYALGYLLVVALAWFVYFVVTGMRGVTEHWAAIAGTFAVLFFIFGSFFVLTYTDFYRNNTFSISISIALIISSFSLLFIMVSSSNTVPDITPVGQYSLCVEILLIIYTVIPLPLYVCVMICTIYSIVFESLSAALDFRDSNSVEIAPGIMVRVLLQLCVHFIGIHILIMTNVRMRGTFMKVGQSLLVRRQLEMEKLLKEKMIHSVMPPKLAEWLMSETGAGRDEEPPDEYSARGSQPSGDLQTLFRPFNMHRMESVSILFADIVGFTRMSSNKSAEQLVNILNVLFEKFDELCAVHGCEKISTLGDCYYCVAGCPEPNPNHAMACVEMGLGMIDAIKQFDEEYKEGVNMRVGIHTGTVLCGIVGTRRIKFDVWSNDVTLANQMESTGKPGRVHVSQATCDFLEDLYILEEGDEVKDVKTYFIEGRKSDLLRFTELNSSLPLVPPSSASPLLPLSRKRVQSCATGTGPRHLHPQQPPRSHYLQLVTENASPRLKASSLPSILDSDNDDDGTAAIESECLSRSPVSMVNSPQAKVWQYQTDEFKVQKGENGTFDVESAAQSSPTIQRSESRNIGAANKQSGNGEAEKTRPGSVVSQLEVPAAGNDDQLSMCLSVNSRKDSGIRSNSRRSSIQQQLFVMNGMANHGELLTHRVSGYYTSSQSSLNEVDLDLEGRRRQLPPHLEGNFGACFHKLRKQSDLQLIRCVQDSATSRRSYFVKPPLSSVSLFFRQKEMEREYRAHAHRIAEKPGDSPPTLATSRYNTYFDILISALVYVAITISLYILYKPSVAWVAVTCVATCIQVFAAILCIRQLFSTKYRTWTGRNLSRKLFEIFSGWYPWHIVGAILVSLPVISVLVNFSGNLILSDSDADFYYCYLLFVALVHFCNFTQLNCWMKSVLATLAGILYVSLATSHAYTSLNDSFVIQEQNVSHVNDTVRFSEEMYSTHYNRFKSVIFNDAEIGPVNMTHKNCNLSNVLCSHFYRAEVFLDVLMLLILVWFLNREFEISYRLSFHGNIVAARDKAKVQSMKNQADLLLHNIIPKHVADQLKNTAKYSENHHDVGIIFASIVNFSEMYDESYAGGKEYVRVLHELVGDFDELLNKGEFRNVEKIKTIGSTYMAASGLNPSLRKENKNPHQHLFELMDFALEMQKVVEVFNKYLFGFNLVLRIGYNFGDVTAGVIGTKKLYYDIWGDAVNVASRMDSTGVRGRIQVGGDCIRVLSERYDFEPRGSVYVKGKDHMHVFLLKGKRTDVNYDDG